MGLDNLENGSYVFWVVRIHYHCQIAWLTVAFSQYLSS